MCKKDLRKILIFSALLSFDFVLCQKSKIFSNCKIGQHINYKDRTGQMKLLICAGKIKGVPQWKFADGSSALGEAFNPARDCSDIVDHLPGAKDGFYWIILPNKTTHQMWCDVHTDGGGFMLIGMKDNPVSWTVPSKSTPVNPQGPPHWSSAAGDVKVLDFRVQFSTDKSFDGTKADWMYRLKPQRELGNLFSINNGCPFLQAGIANISFVKDLMTESVLTHKFKCSKFGQHVHHSLGWGKMNYCLRNACKNGYAHVLLYGIPLVIDKFGSFSYSAVSSYSGMNHNSTAFVGCDQGKCCACFGPKGGRQNYCGPKCTAVNGGTVTKEAFVWLWVRTRIPTRLWERCMEFTVNNSAGKQEKHFVDPRTGTLHKGSCSKQFKAFLNEGTLTVPNKKSLEMIPNVPGLLSYRADKKQLYVNEGSKWQELSNEPKLQQLKKQIQSQEQMIKKLEKQIQDVINRTNRLHPPSPCSALLMKHPSTTSGKYYIKLQNSKSLVQVYCNMTSKNGVGVTVIGHDSESRTLVNGYESGGSYKRKINYNISVKLIVAIIKQSRNCEQFIKYECHNSQLLAGPHGWWVSRQGSQMNYWGGAAVNSGKCACGTTNSCAAKVNCNCDINDNTWREDSGYLTDKNTLPVTELRLSDTGDSYEIGYHTLGKLQCWD